LKLWKTRKGLSEDTWKWAAQEINKIHQMGFNYKLIYGVELPVTKVDKEIGAHCYESAFDGLQQYK
jgi:hypothetical protein